MPSQTAPLSGSCACGTVRFQVTAPFKTAGYCHCNRCQHRTGALWSLNAVVDSEGFEIVDGEEAIRTWQPESGMPKSFCAHCGGHIFAGDRRAGPVVGVRIGALDGDPGIRPQWHQWLESAHAWDELPDDGLPRFQRARSTG
jgi:hypothetical protein